MTRRLSSFVFVLAITAAAPAAAAQPGRFVSDDMNRQIETVDERRTTTSGNDQVNANGERLICRREMHQTQSRMARAPRICLTAREWRRRN